MVKRKTNRRKESKINPDHIIIRRRVVKNKKCQRCENRRDLIYFDTYDVRTHKTRMAVYFCEECIMDLLKKEETKKDSMYDILQYMLDPTYILEILDEEPEVKEEQPKKKGRKKKEEKVDEPVEEEVKEEKDPVDEYVENYPEEEADSMVDYIEKKAEEKEIPVVQPEEEPKEETE